MYLDDFSFLGISTQQGQPKTGLIDSAPLALKLMPHHWSFSHSKILIEAGSPKQIHSTEDLSLLNWSIYSAAHQQIRNHLSQGRLHLNWGGDHSIGISSVAAFTSLYSNGYVLWIDAHADLNTPESSLTGNFHGMPLSILMGIGNKPSNFAHPFWNVLDPKRLIYFGLRDIDPYEKHLIQNLGITAYYCEELNTSGLFNCLQAIKLKIANHPLHISFDIDSIDPLFAPSTGVISNNGLSPFHLHALAKKIGSANNIKSVDVVEINPTIGTSTEANNTYAVAFNFLDKLFNFKRGNFYDSTYSTVKNQLQVSHQRNISF